MSQSENCKSVAVIGAGLAGLVTIKELLEKGHSVTCFEAKSDVGGVFADPRTYDSVELTVSNYFMAFSDFMPTEERLKFWTKKEYLNYLKCYMRRFKLRGCIELETRVISVTQGEGGWQIETRHEGTTCRQKFDAVAVCSGQFQKVNLPDLEGSQNFQGTILHSTDYTNAQQFSDKKVLCIGLGESSADITAEVADVAAQTTLSLRRRPLVAQRYFAVLDRSSYNVKYPLDVFTTSRTFNTLPRDIHTKVTQSTFQKFINSHDPATRLRGQWNRAAGPESQQVIVKNERVFDAIVDGKVQVNASGIRKLSETTVEFNDGQQQEIDTVICCTGFTYSIPFLQLPIEDPRQLYKNMIHPGKGSSLALIGFVRPQQGGVPALAELQARYFALLCSEDKVLPKAEELVATAAEDAARWQNEFALTPQVSGLVNFVHFAEDLARCIGCELKVDHRTDPELARKCAEGPLWAIQYRLQGPGARTQSAREVLLAKTPVPFKSSWLARFAYLTLLWLRSVLPVASVAKPRYP